jgi:hypothetical protein
MNTKLVLVLLASLGALALQISGLHSWAEASSPSFVGGALTAVVTAVSALYVSKPEPRA